MQIKLIFKYTNDQRRKKVVPSLVGLWIEGYGWIVGGTTAGDFQIIQDIDAGPEIKRAIADTMSHGNWSKYGLLPIIRRKNDPEPD